MNLYPRLSEDEIREDFARNFPGFCVSTDRHLMPKLDESFDRHAAEQCRSLMAIYHDLPPEYRSLLENIAIRQAVES